MLPIIDPQFKEVIPPLSPEERSQLEHNILESKKCRDAIILWEGIIIDGHNRYEICTKHGITFGIREMEFATREDAMVWIIENQLGRRNLNDAARIELALQKAELFREKAKRNKIRSGRDRHRAGEVLSETSICQKNPINVRKELATEADVSEGNLHYYMQIKNEGSPELLEKVKSGEMKIGSAHRLLGKQILKELKLADGMYKYILANIPTEDEEVNRVIYEGLAELREKLREIQRL
ncbi:MAG: hypothetical protein FWB80_01390 [Defluviitaleaceae bacterium]|nr:hypothetical protein [Defluviitaleaceae bacterium]